MPESQLSTSIFKTGSIIHLDKFEFNVKTSEDEKKGRFLIVLFEDGQEVIFAITTRTINIDINKDSKTGKGCIKAKEPNHCHYYPENFPIGKAKAFCFPDHCVVHLGSNPGVFLKKHSELQKKYIDIDNYEVLDIIHDDEYHDLVYCVYKSINVIRHFKNKLEKILESLGQSNPIVVEKIPKEKMDALMNRFNKKI